MTNQNNLNTKYLSTNYSSNPCYEMQLPTSHDVYHTNNNYINKFHQNVYPNTTNYYYNTSNIDNCINYINYDHCYSFINHNKHQDVYHTNIYKNTLYDNLYRDNLYKAYDTTIYHSLGTGKTLYSYYNNSEVISNVYDGMIQSQQKIILDNSHFKGQREVEPSCTDEEEDEEDEEDDVLTVII